ncbi:TATA box-binding protein-associated factor RNA polymerase I subunit B [Chelonus insularis]|uniref:TATA box-binding protein-associated factor RNA polymerase I subunit B n=1 Tax=Chelonus insularis TaxID=460826 RepID=UPI001588F68F|nr:TATA box-binding protein-associated factor RNA polymerase I subunit B [Chelonus insularis]
MDNCAVCGGQDFYLDSGFYFCKECQTQQEGVREQVVDYNPTEHGTRLIKTRIRKKQAAQEEVSGWTTWEKYNFIIIGLANQLIDLGVSSDIKLTLLQLWATYLGKLEVAFKSTTTKTLPKLPRCYDQKDVQIIYGTDGKPKKKKKIKKTDGSSVAGTSMISESNVSRFSLNREFNKKKTLMMKSEYRKYLESQDASEVDRLSESNASHSSVQTNASDKSGRPKKKIRKSIRWLNKNAQEEAKQAKVLSKSLPRNEKRKFQDKYASAKYKTGPGVITAKRLWAIVYLALRINNEKLHLSDLLRYSREGHLSYFRLEHFFPPDVTLSTSELSKIHPTADLGYRTMRAIINRMAKFLQVWELPPTDLASLLRKFCTELQLPEGIYLYAERLLASSPPGMNFSGRTVFFPNYEGRVMAIIIVVMKILFGLDGITEYKISRVIERINMVTKEKDSLDSRLFNFCEWQRYIECRRCILVNEHLPTKLKRDPSASENSHLYIEFIQSLESKQEIDESEKKYSQGYIPTQLARTMKQEIERLQINDLPRKEIPSFPPSLTPQHSYLQQLLQDPNRALPSILRQDFPSTKVGYITRPESLVALAAESNIELNYVDISPHFVEKVVPIFKPLLLPDIKNQRANNINNEPIKVVTPSTDSKANSLKFVKSDDPSEYLHRKHPGQIFIDSKKQRLFKKMQILEKNNKKYEDVEVDDFEFDQVNPDGKLKIPNDEDDIGEEESTNAEKAKLTDLEKNYKLILSNFEKQIMLGPVENPWEEERKFWHQERLRGRYVKKSKIVKNKTENMTKKKEVDEIKIEDNNTSNGDTMEVVEEASDSNPVASDSDELLILAENIKPKQNTSNNSTLEHEQMTFFRPFKEYWLRRCQHFSHIFPQHFRLLERNLPVNFRWLLHECAHVIEMTVEGLYEEVCLVESYFGYVFPKNNDLEKCKKYKTENYRSEAYRSSIRNKWNT